MTEFEAVYVGANALAQDAYPTLRLRVALPRKPDVLADFAGGTAELWDSAKQGARVVAAIEPDSDVTIRIVAPSGLMLRAFGPRIDCIETIVGQGKAVPVSLAEGSKLQVFRSMRCDEYELHRLWRPAVAV